MVLVLGCVVVLVLLFFASVGAHQREPADAVRPVLTQMVRPGAAYLYGPVRVFNGCSMVRLEDLRRQGLTPAPDQELREYFPVVDQPDGPLNSSELGGPSDCHVFVEGRHGEGNVQIEVQQTPYTDMGHITRQLPRYERDGYVYHSHGVRVVFPPDTRPDYLRDDSQRIAEAYLVAPA
ncbi:MAG: hypothetical protein ACRDQD_21260, partial [Nocardioidaceae bacterium]